jgi:hypothetical protein
MGTDLVLCYSIISNGFFMGSTLAVYLPFKNAKGSPKDSIS